MCNYAFHPSSNQWPEYRVNVTLVTTGDKRNTCNRLYHKIIHKLWIFFFHCLCHLCLSILHHPPSKMAVDCSDSDTHDTRSLVLGHLLSVSSWYRYPVYLGCHRNRTYVSWIAYYNHYQYPHFLTHNIHNFFLSILPILHSHSFIIKQ